MPSAKIRASWASIPAATVLARLNPAATEMMGMLIRKEKRAASSLRKPRKSPMVMVAPERETPGTSAAAWASPMPSAPKRPSLDAPSPLPPTASATRNSAPTTARLTTTSQGLRAVVAMKSSNTGPETPAGTVAATIR